MRIHGRMGGIRSTFSRTSFSANTNTDTFASLTLGLVGWHLPLHQGSVSDFSQARSLLPLTSMWTQLAVTFTGTRATQRRTQRRFSMNLLMHILWCLARADSTGQG